MTEFQSSTCNSPLNHKQQHEKLIDKLRIVLEKLLLPNFKCSDDTVLNKLYDCVSSCLQENWGTEQNFDVLFKLFTPWVQSAITNWSILTTGVKVFVLRIAGLFIRYTEGFVLLTQNETITKIVNCLKVQNNLKNSSVALAYVDLLLSISNHDDGLKWIVQTECWRDIIGFAHNCQSIYLIKKSWQFLAIVVVKMENIQLDVSHCILNSSVTFTGNDDKLMVAGDLVNPEIFSTSHQMIERSENHNLVNSAKLTREIIITVLEHKLPAERINRLFKNCHIDKWAWTQIHNSKSTKEIAIASQLLRAWNCLSIHCTKDHEVPNASAQNFIQSMINHFTLLITRKLFNEINESCVDYQHLWDRFGGKVVIENGELPRNNVDDHEDEVYRTENVAYRVQNLLFIVQAMPLFVCAKINSKTLETNNLLETYVEKLMRFASPKLIRLCYFYRDQMHSPDVPLETYSRNIIFRLIGLSSIYKKEQAVLVFQAFIHLLKVLITEDSNEELIKEGKISVLVRCPELLSALLNGLICYLSKFKFSWRDSLETVCIMSFAQCIIHKSHIPPKICSESLKLIKLILTNFLPPNLALLVDTLQGSSIKHLGKQLFKTLHSLHWEVRDSTLEVLQTISCLAEAKFPAFQSLLLEEGLPELIIHAMNSDSEPYVRATAISCIGEMVKIQNIWTSALQNKGILEKLLLMLHYESEGLVRKNAALLVRDIYQYQTIPPLLLEQTYDTLYHVARCDLHWEVKSNALDFWECVIDKNFSDEGMVDGYFPEMIFSKEKKKIIQLTSRETCCLVLKVIRKLSNNGCLCVLWGTTFDECDLEVQRKSVNLVKKLKHVVNKYNVIKELEKFNSNEELELFDNLKSNNVDLVDIEMELSENDNMNAADFPDVTELHSVDEVIDQIIRQEDIQLLPGLVRTSQEIKVLPKIKRFIIPAEDFIEKMLLLDVNKVLDDKFSWNKRTSEGIESLLDDIIQFSKGDNCMINSVDCY